MTRPPIADLNREQKVPGGTAKRIIAISGIAGIVLLLASFGLGMRGDAGRDRLFASILVSFAYFLSISLGALFFVMLHHLAHATWSVVVRRFAEAIAANVEILVLFFVLLLLGARHIYVWADPVAEPHAVTGSKATWLSVRFFAIRFAVYFAIWIFLARSFLRRSVAQDKDGGFRLTRAMERLSAPGMVIYALTVTLASFDLLMSLDPHWVSTIFGVYFFSGGVLAFFAALPLVAWITQRSGRLTHAITAEHYHDMGKLVFAFTIFWAYIAFSQYMLIWYGNLPEETGWYLRRLTNGWGKIGLVLLFGHFVIPFVFLLPRSVKRNPRVLAFPAMWILLMHAVDMYWLVIPQARGAAAGIGVRPVDLTTFLGMGSLFVAAAVWRLQKAALIAERDPRITESLAFESA
jgi:hypothetical protein